MEVNKKKTNGEALQIKTLERDTNRALVNISKQEINIAISIEKKELDEIREVLSVSLHKFLEQKVFRISRELDFINCNKDLFQSLTKREKQILKLLSQGLNNPQIGETLFISRRTVEEHRKNLNKKLNIKNHIQILRFANAFEILAFKADI